MRRRSLIAATAVVTVSAFAFPVLGEQTPEKPKTPALLSILMDDQPASSADALAQGVSQLSNKQYEEALASLQQAKASDLDEAQKAQLSSALAEAEKAAGERKAARAAFEQGEAALASGDSVTAIWHYKAARENQFADAGTVDKARTQTSLALNNLGDAKELYASAKSDLDAGNLQAAKAKFTALEAVGYRGGTLSKSPSDQLKVIAEKEAALSAAPTAAVATMSEPANSGASSDAATPMTDSPAPQMSAAEMKKAGRAAYVAGREAYARGDTVAAKANFQRATDLGYKAGFGEVGPQKMLTRIAQKENTDAKRAAVALRSQEATEAAVATAAAIPDTGPAATDSTDTLVASAQTAPTETAVTQTPPTEAPVNTTPAVQATESPVVAPDNVVTTAQNGDALQATADAARIKKENDVFQAAQLVVKANEARNGERYADAGRLYDEALALDPNNADAQRGKQEVLAATGREPRVGDPLTDLENIIRAKKEAIAFNINTAVDQARQAQGTGDFVEANRALIKAQAARDSDTTIFTAEELNSFDSLIRTARSEVNTAEATAREAKIAADQQDAINRQNEAAKAADIQKRDTVSALTKQARTLTQQGRYADALKIIDQIISIDPKNDYASGVRQLIADRKSFQDQRRIAEKIERNTTDILTDADEARVPIPDLLTYPEDWPDLTAMRDATLARERGGSTDAAVESMLAKQLPELRFDGVPLVDVVEFLRDTTQANIFVNWSAIEGAGIDKNTPITTRLKNVRFSKVLGIVLDSAGGGIIRLGYTIDDGVITISTQEDLAKNVSTRTYDIRDLLVNISNFQAPSFTPSSGGEGSGGGELFATTDTNQQDQDTERDTIVEQITQLITDTIATDTWKVNGGLVGAVQELGGQLIVTQTPENQTAIGSLLEKLRETRAIQVNVEARFLTVQRNFLEEVGVDFDFQFNVDPSFPGNFNPDSDFSPVLVSQNSLSQTTTGTPLGFTNPGNLATGLNTNLGNEAQSNSYGLTTGVNAYLDDFRASLLLRAVQLGQNATTLTAPRVTLFNGQRAFIRVSTIQNYVSDLNPVVGTGTVGYDPQIDQIQTGVLLDVTATVSADRRYVTLTVLPTLQRLIALRQFAFASGNATVTTDNGVAQQVQTFVQLPEFEVTQVQTTVSVPQAALHQPRHVA
jgi:tetratricopeptide (TPR) repeat protein